MVRTTFEARPINDIRPGFYKRQLVRNGPYVACQIHHETARDPETGEALDRSWYWWAEIDGQLAGPVSPSALASDDVWAIHLYGVPITRGEYDDLLGRAEHARGHAPHLPEANPRAPIKLHRLPSLY